MKNFHLSPEEVLELRAAHRAERNRNESYKINAVILLGTGWKLKDVKEALLLDDETLRSYVKKYQSGGIKGLLETHYFGRQARLTKKQSKMLCDELDTHIYLTTSEVIHYVKNTFSIANLNNFSWKNHCNRLFQTPIPI